MTFNDIIEDLEKLKGLNLKSIKSGADLRIVDIDLEKGSYIVERIKNGEKKSRPISELERIWKSLVNSPAVYVDNVLNGSGSSRNQPETVLANLPYIEWLKVDNKKHLSLVKSPSHPYGTLKLMNSVDAAKVIESMKERAIDVLFVIATSHISSAIKWLRNIVEGEVIPYSQKEYIFRTKDGLVLVGNLDSFGITERILPVLKGNFPQNNNQTIKLCGYSFRMTSNCGMDLLIKER